MQAPKTKVLTLILAAVMVVGTLDAAAARQKKKHHSSRPVVTQTDRVPGTLVPVDRDGTPIIMQGYRSPRMLRDAGEPAPKQRADRPVRIPRGSSTYIPPVNPSPYSVNSPPATVPMVQPYTPPPINSFGDRVTNAIHDFPLQRGLGNNPNDLQGFIRQRA